MSRFAARHPRIALVLVTGVTAVFATGLPKLRIETAAEKFLPADAQPIAANQRVIETFGTQEAVMIGLVTEGDAFDTATLTRVAELTRRLQQMTLLDDTGVEVAVGRVIAMFEEAGHTSAAARAIQREIDLRSRPFDDVLSLTTTESIDSSAAGLEIEPVMAEPPTDAGALRALRERVLGDRLLRGMLVSADGSSLAVIATLRFRSADWKGLTGDLVARVRAVAAEVAGDEQVFVAGVPVVNTLLVEEMESDMSRLMPLVIGLLAAVLLVSFRTASGVLLPIAVVVIALVWTFGLMGLVDRPIGFLTTSMPVIVLAVGVAAALHVLAHFGRNLARGDDRRRAFARTAEEVTGAIVMTSLTTAVGFASLAVSSLHSMRDYGLFTAFGTLASLVVTLLLVPAVLMSSRAKARDGARSGPAGRGALERLSVRATFAARRPALVLVPAVLLVGAAALLATRIHVGTKMTGNFDADSEIYRAGRILNDKFGGTQALDIVLDTGAPDGVKHPEVLEWIAGLQRELADHAPVGYSLSLADMIRRMNLVLHVGAPEEDRIPPPVIRLELGDGEVEEVRGLDRVEQYLLLYESAGGDELARVVDFDYRRARIMAQIQGDDHEIARRAINRARAYIAREPPPGAVELAGCANLCVFSDDLIVPSQTRSLAVAVVIVTLLLATIFRSLRLGLIGVAPMVLTIAIAFGTMGLLGIPLDVMSAMFASIVLGIGVDYAIHLISWYRRQRLAGQLHGPALEDALAGTGRPILLNAVAVGAGFLVLVASGFYPVRVIGTFVAAALLLSAAGNLLVVPALLGVRAGGADRRDSYDSPDMAHELLLPGEPSHHSPGEDE